MRSVVICGSLKKNQDRVQGDRRMKLKPKQTIADYFADVEDPRIERTKRHQLIDVITIAICAVICGADSCPREGAN